MIPIHVLISLLKGYGVGDACQMSAVLRHVVKARPHWIIDFQAEQGYSCIGNGIVANTFMYGQPYPSPHYDAEVEIRLYDTFANWGDRPNTRVSSCLHECFGLEWNRDWGRYKINISGYARGHASIIVPRYAVAIHYRGDSSQSRKNLSHEQATEICKHVVSLGREPLLLDWRNEWPLKGQRVVGEMGRDVEMNCAVIAQCNAFVGIDSGPSKCASATETSALVTWTGHHPAPFHDPAPNTTHLVPAGYHGLEPVCNDPGVIRWFEENYNVRTYDRDPVLEIKAWLTTTLT